MTIAFVHDWLPQHVVFAPGEATAAVAAEVERLGARRVMVIAAEAEERLADQVSNGLPVAVRYADVAMHVPLEAAERARRAAGANTADLLVPVGGGSTTGLAKAIALTSGLPIVAVPTTYAGSEATSVWGLTENRRKTTGVDSRVLPQAVIYDAELTVSLPVATSVASGMNALAHCLDSMWAPRSDPIDRALAGEGIMALNTALPAIVDDPSSAHGRQSALYGAYLSAKAFSSAGSGLHHKICHVLGGMYDLPHAQTHAVMLPYALALNAPHAPDAADRIAAALGADDPVTGLESLRNRIDAPRSLREYGLAESDIPAAVQEIVAEAPPSNPAPISPQTITYLLHAAWEGSDPK